jgi:hypothetical protein
LRAISDDLLFRDDLRRRPCRDHLHELSLSEYPLHEAAAFRV